MALGLHSFYGYSISGSNGLKNKEDYFIGCLIGDHFADEHFSWRIKKVVDRLVRVYGYGYFTYYWSAAVTKPYHPRTNELKLVTAIKKATKKHLQQVAQIKRSAYLFEAEFITEAENRLLQQKEVLQQRYSN